MKKLLLALSLATLLVVSSASVAAAGKGSLTIEPSPVHRGDTFTLSGCGYPTPTSLSFRVVGPGVNYFTAGEPLTGDGCFAQTWLAWWSEPGAYQITSYYRDSKGATRKVAVVKFTVT